MISPNTPPGTEVVAIVDCRPDRGLPGFKRGSVFTVDRIAEAEFGKFVAILREHGIGEYIDYSGGWAFWRWQRRKASYGIDGFRYLDLAGLDALLDVRENLPA